MTRLHVPSSSRHQQGLTLIELMVAMTLGLLVVLIAAAALLLGQQGYRSVDSTTALRDKERFAIDLVSHVIVQAGFQDFGAAQISVRSTFEDPEPDLYGWNNAIYAEPNDINLSASTNITHENRPARCSVTDTSCRNGSDILVVRYQGVNSTTAPLTSDNTMINCAGQGDTGLIDGNLRDRAISIFHVIRGANGEPSLACSYFAGGLWVPSAPLVEGVESFQVLYGTDGMTLPGEPAVAADSVVDRWFRADQLTVAGNLVLTRANWRKVRAVRVGLVIRGPVGSAPQAATATLTPLGSLYTQAADVGASLAVAADQRLRTQTTFTVHLRNDLSLRK